MDWNINQVALVFWSTFYDNIYEHPERPDQRIIDNDDLLDRWVEQKGKEIEERARKNAKNSMNGGFSAYDHEEVIIFDEEEWEEVVDEEYEEEIDEE